VIQALGRNKMKKQYNINDTIKVNEGIHTEDFNINLSGYIGTITDIIDDHEDILYHIEWDAITLNGMDLSSIKYLEVQQYDWEFSLLYESEFNKTQIRCTTEETEHAINILKEKIKNNS